MVDIRRVVAATDDSEQAAHAKDVAALIARSAGAVVDVVTVRPARAAGAPAGSMAGTACPPLVELRGLPGVEIVHHADQHHADLVVLGRSPRSRSAPAMLGPTSDGVIRRRSGPTLLVPREIDRVRCILVALDGSRRGLAVLDTAVTFARQLGAGLSAVCVLPEPPDSLGEGSGWLDPRRVRVEQAAAQYANGSGPLRLTVCCGDPVDRILRTVEELGCDVLVLGVRRGGPPGQLGSGHIGRDVLRAAPCAVLTVPI